MLKELYKVKQSNLNLYDEHVLGITSFNKEHLIKHGYSEGRLPYQFELDIDTYNKKLRIIEEERPLLTHESDMISHFVERGYRLLF